MSTLSYNGVALSLLRTTDITHEVEREADGTYLWTKVTIGVIGILNEKATSYTLSNGGFFTAAKGAKPSDTMRAIRNALLQPRGSLVYTPDDSDTPMISSPDAGSFVDANNGPTPLTVEMIPVGGIKTFQIKFRISTCLIECPAMNGDEPSALISNRSEQTHSIDANHFTTITTRGQALFRTDVLVNANQVADHYRQLLLPPVPRGFQRQHIDVVATPSHNALTYQCVDLEKAFDLGDTSSTGTNSQITNVHASYSVSSTGTNGGPINMMSLHRVEVSVWGNKSASAWNLTKFAWRLADAKLPGIGGGNFLRQIGITQTLTEPHVSLVAELQSTLKPGGIPGLNMEKLQEDSPFAEQGGLNPVFPSRGGTAGTYANQALTNAWKSVCGEVYRPGEGRVASDAEDPAYPSNNTGPIVRAGTSEDLPEFGYRYGESQSVFPYNEYKIGINYRRKNHIHQTPLTGKVRLIPLDQWIKNYNSGSGSGSSGSGGSSGNPGSQNPGRGTNEADAARTSDAGGSSGGGGFAGGGGGSNGSDGSDDSDAATCVFLALSQPMMRKVVEWTAERIGEIPSLPPSAPVDQNLVLIDDSDVQVCEPTLMPDGITLCYRVSGRYVYGLKRPLRPSDPIPLPAVPWQDLQYGDYMIGETNFTDGIIDQISQSPSDPGPTPPGTTTTTG